MKAFERRLVSLPVQARSDDGKPTVVTGYAAVFGSEAVIAGMFRERIEPGAFRSVIGTGCDVRALLNHDDNMVLARTTNGTLRLSEDERGLAYEFDPNPNDTDAMNTVAKIVRGDISQSSYGFRVKADTWTKAIKPGDLPLRTITEIDILRDVSPVTFPAFDDTSVTAEARSAATAARADATDDDTAEENAVVAACQVALDALAACVAACAPMVSDEDAGGAVREAVSASACAMTALGRAQAACSGQPMYSYYAGDLATERARIDAIEVE